MIQRRRRKIAAAYRQRLRGKVWAIDVMAAANAAQRPLRDEELQAYRIAEGIAEEGWTHQRTLRRWWLP